MDNYTKTKEVIKGNEKKNLSLGALIALIVGSMIGGGAFNLPSDMAKGANSGAVLIGWLITGIGMIALAFVYQNLSRRKPELDGGIYSYARDGFGDYVGFNSAWGYWISAWLGNVSYAVLLFGALSYFFPVFENGNNLASIIGASLLIWGIHFLILKGVREAAIVNIITTIAKLVPIIVFIIAAIMAFNLDKFQLDFWGTGNISFSSVLEQVKSTMLVTLWVFIGIEGAVVVSGRAKDRNDVGKATVIGLLGTLLIYLLISGLSLGIMTQPELKGLDNPSMAYVLESIVGEWGAGIINFGLVISLLGATLGWTLLAAEIPYVAAKDGVLPKMFSKENENNSPSSSLWITNGLVQLFLIITLFSESTYRALFLMASTAILLPYLFSGLYQLKLTITKDGYEKTKKSKIVKHMITSIIASIYGLWLVYAAGLDYLLMVTILYAPGMYFYYKAKKEKNLKAFKPYELVIGVALIIAAIIALVLIYNGTISPL